MDDRLIIKWSKACKSHGISFYTAKCAGLMAQCCSLDPQEHLSVLIAMANNGATESQLLDYAMANVDPACIYGVDPIPSDSDVPFDPENLGNLEEEDDDE